MLKDKKVFLLLGVAILALAGASFPSPVAADVATPSFMPGFPMLAGPQVMIMWMPVPGAKEYKVYKNGAVVVTTPSNQHFDQVGDSPGEYKYQVSAVGLDGKEGAKTAEKVIQIVKLIAPVNLDGRLMGKTVGVRWDPVKGAPVYNVYRAEKDVESEYKLKTSVTMSNFSDSDIVIGKKYFYKVSAKDLSGKESPLSKALVVDLKVEEAKAAEEDVKYRKTRTVRVFKDGVEPLSMKRVDLRAPAALALTKDRVYITSTGSNLVSVFQKEDGMFLFTIGKEGRVKEGAAVPRFVFVTTVAVNPGGDLLYVADTGGKAVYIFDLEGNLKKSFSPEPPKPPEVPINVLGFDVDADGNAWFPDVRNNLVRVYDDNGKEIRSFGKGQVFNPAYVHIDAKNKRVVVVNQQGDKVGISLFGLDGKFIKRFGSKGVGGGKFWAPAGVDVMADGSIVNADGINSIINVFDAEGNIKYHLKDEDGKRVVQIASARGIAVEGERVYVASSIVNEVEVLEMFGDPILEKK